MGIVRQILRHLLRFALCAALALFLRPALAQSEFFSNRTENNFLWEYPGLPDTILSRNTAIPIRNQRGDTSALMTSGANSPYATFEYGPYGEVIKDTATVTLDQYPYRFSGRENDGNDLYYLRNRYYAPILGRFMSEDPIGFMGGMNLYAYCNNNPITFSDPLGLFPVGGTAEHPWFNFTLEGFNTGVRTGAAATASVFSYGLYDGGSFRCQPSFGGSVVLATIGRTALEAAAMEGAGAALKVSGPCFAGDTLIFMADVSGKPIDQIQYGDYVRTRSDATGLVEQKQVTSVSVRQVTDSLLIRFDDGSTIRTTREHPFWVEGSGWVRAGRLAVGSAISTRAEPKVIGKSATVSEVKSVAGRITVYNFTVEDSHTYFVGNGKSGWKWVHNDCTNVALKQLTKEGEGAIIRLEPQGGPKFWLEEGRWGHHDVLLKTNGRVFDPMRPHADGLHFDEWVETWKFRDSYNFRYLEPGQFPTHAPYR